MAALTRICTGMVLDIGTDANGKRLAVKKCKNF
jgi:hypothetical protein